MGEQLPVGIYRARRALQRLRDHIAAGRLTAGRSEPFLLPSRDPALQAAVRQALAEQVARVRAITSEGPGQYGPAIILGPPSEVICEQCEHVDGHAPDCPVAPIDLDTFRDLLVGWLGQWGSTVDSITTPPDGFPSLRVRLFSGQTIKIILREVPE